MFKAGLLPSEVKMGKTRLGGTFGTRFTHNGKFYNAGTPASAEAVNAASAYYNNPNSPLAMSFGGAYNLNPGVKLGRTYGVNPYGAGQVADHFIPVTAATSYMATKKE
jgi:hypothetical protein